MKASFLKHRKLWIAGIALVLILGAGGGTVYYFLVMKPKQAKNVPSDLDDFDLEDEEEYLNDDEESEDTI